MLHEKIESESYFGRPKPILEVLVVEDNPADASILKRYLQKISNWEISIRIVDNQTEAGSQLNENSFDFVFVDNHLGKVHGIELIEQWCHLYSHSAFVLLTGQGDENIITAAFRAGAKDYLSKGQLSVDTLLTCIQKITDNTRKHERVKSILDSIPDALLMIDEDGIVHETNSALKQIFGYEPDELIGQSVTRLIPDSLVDQHNAGMQLYRATGESRVIGKTVELLGKKVDGEIFPIELSLSETTLYGEQYFYGIIRDISQRKEMEKLRSEQSIVIDTTNDIVVFVSPEKTIRYLNPAGKKVLNIPTLTSDAEEMPLVDLFSSECILHIDEQVIPTLQLTGSWVGELELVDIKDSHNIPVSVVATAISDHRGPIRSYAFVMRDITKTKMYEQQLEDRALKDPLTGLANRTLLVQQTEEALKRAKRHSERLALLFIDLDQFKSVNDTLGHDVGDQLLIEVSKRLVNSTRETDLVARLGGDEFVLLLEQKEGLDINGISVVADKLMKNVGKAYRFMEQEIYVTPSIGIATYPECGDTAEELMKKADIAMYQVKEEGRNTYRYFSDEMNIKMQHGIHIKNIIRQIVDTQDFELAFQTIVNEKKEMVGVEALLRVSQNGESLPPYEIIKIAEQHGIMLPLGDVITERAIKTLAEWRKEFQYEGYMSINTSILQLRQNAFSVRVQELLKQYDVPSHCILFEITETTLVENIDSCIASLAKLKALGVRLAIDDFGTGYASFRHLYHMPIDVIKIDRSFVLNIISDEKLSSTVSAILDMANTMKLDVIVEGIETVEQHNWFDNAQKTFRQGFFYKRPIENIKSMLDLKI